MLDLSIHIYKMRKLAQVVFLHCSISKTITFSDPEFVKGLYEIDERAMFECDQVYAIVFRVKGRATGEYSFPLCRNLKGKEEKR